MRVFSGGACPLLFQSSSCFCFCSSVSNFCAPSAGKRRSDIMRPFFPGYGWGVLPDDSAPRPTVHPPGALQAHLLPFPPLLLRSSRMASVCPLSIAFLFQAQGLLCPPPGSHPPPSLGRLPLPLPLPGCPCRRMHAAFHALGSLRGLFLFGRLPSVCSQPYPSCWGAAE